MKKGTTIFLAFLLMAGLLALPVPAATSKTDDVILFEDFEYDPAAYTMGENFCYGNGDQETPPTGTYENRGKYWIGARRNGDHDMLSYASIVPGAGVDGSAALSVSSTVTYSDNSQSDIQVFTEEPLDVSAYKYLIVWCDFTKVELRGSSFSLITKDGIYGGTDERDGEYDDYYYL